MNPLTTYKNYLVTHSAFERCFFVHFMHLQARNSVSAIKESSCYQGQPHKNLLNFGALVILDIKWFGQTNYLTTVVAPSRS